MLNVLTDIAGLLVLFRLATLVLGIFHEQRFISKMKKETKEEFEEFQEGSKELEQELETQLEQAEKSVKEFKSLANRLQLENDSLKDKLEQCHKEYHYQVSNCTVFIVVHKAEV